MSEAKEILELASRYPRALDCLPEVYQKAIESIKNGHGQKQAGAGTSSPSPKKKMKKGEDGGNQLRDTV